MEFGINFFPVFSAAEKTAAGYFGESLELAELADGLGYGHIRTVAHYFPDYGGASPNPLIFLAAASQRSRRARLIVGCAVPAFGHPIQIASEVRMLDALSGGRVELGLARGFLPYEYDLFGVQIDESAARFSEACRQIRLLLSQRSASDAGLYHSFSGVSINPPPTQMPHPPLWIAAVASRQSFARAGALGFDLMTLPHGTAALRDLISVYREARAASDYPGPGRVMIAFHLVIADTHEKALAIARAPLARYSAALCHAMAEWKTRSSVDYAIYRDVLAKLEQDSVDDQIRRGAAWVGSADAVGAAIDAYNVGVGGFDVASLQVNFDMIPIQAAVHTLRRFASDVAPRLKTSIGTT